MKLQIDGGGTTESDYNLGAPSFISELTQKRLNY